jgi:hypothetical protein
MKSKKKKKKEKKKRGWLNHHGAAPNQMEVGKLHSGMFGWWEGM